MPRVWDVNSKGVISLMWNIEMNNEFTNHSSSAEQSGGFNPYSQSFGRRLQNEIVGQSNGEEDSYSYLLEVSLVKESEEELVPEVKLNYTYEQEWYNSTLQLLTLHFVAPDYVS